MDGRWTELCKCRSVRGRRVADVFGKSIAWVLSIIGDHEIVAMDFGEYRL